jgi:hypothetical protein
MADARRGFYSLPSQRMRRETMSGRGLCRSGVPAARQLPGAIQRGGFNTGPPDSLRRQPDAPIEVAMTPDVDRHASNVLRGGKTPRAGGRARSRGPDGNIDQ